jgi:glutamyl-tRNA synthetase
MSSSSSAPAPGYRGRIAPSPTGYLHVGHARTFWTAFERARAACGVLVMRMEDLDPERSRAEYAEAALEDLRWLGIEWQEGPGRMDAQIAPQMDAQMDAQIGSLTGSQIGPQMDGPYASYAQSGRRAIYLDAWRRLRRGGFLFPCRCSRKDLEAALSAPHESNSPAGRGGVQSDVLSHPCDKNKSVARMGHPANMERPASIEMDPLDDEPVYPGTCRAAAGRLESNCSSAEDQAARPIEGAGGAIEEPGCFNWRFRVPDGEVIEFEDGNLGPQRFVAGVDFGDFVVWRRDGVPSYQLACVADDAAMKMTEVVRGEDLRKSTARQILLYRALGLDTPDWFHCRLAVDANGRRLAKRSDALSLRALRERGVSPAEILSNGLLSQVSESRPGAPARLRNLSLRG